MEAQEKELWARLQGFVIDDPAAGFKFSARLARENGWTIPYSLRVIEEYKKFIFLCCVTKQGVTPSDPVDQAWHLHLTFTRSYWTDLCKNTLGQEIHHNPTKGGQQEATKFDGFYTSTHQLYKDKFGHEPPADIWQDNHTRFSDINFQRVNVGKYWVVRKLPETAYAVLVLILAAICFTFIRADSVSPFIVIGFVILLVRAVYKAETKRNNQGPGNGNDNSGGTSGCGGSSDGHHGHSGCSGGHHGGDSGCSSHSGCSGCSSSGCSGCGSGCGGGD
jgi:hypothetical protein